MKGNNGVVVQSVLRALDILILFQDENELGISEIAKCMRLGKSTVFGLVSSLVARGFLEQSKTNKKYRLGIRNFELGRYMQQRMDLRSEATRIVHEILGKFQETVNLAVHDRGEVIYLEAFRVPDVTVLYTLTGRRAPMHCSSVGKSMLAFLSDEYLEQFVFSKQLVALTPKTITDPQAVRDELLLVRKRGYALDDEEIEMGIKCVGAPIFDFSQTVIASVSICAPIHRMTNKQIEAVTPEIVRCARLISQRMGFRERF